MSSYGVLDTGFVDKPTSEILSDIEAQEKSTIDAGLDVSASSLMGQINGIVASHLRELWELAQAVYSAFDPDTASDDALTNIAALTGTLRRAATKSTVTATVNLNAGVTLPIGSIASVSGDSSARFVTTAVATNSGGSPANFSVEMESESTGPIVANTGTLTVIETPVTGWNSITNAADAILGLNAETDSQLRLRREQELRQGGDASVGALVSAVSAVANVTSLSVTENATSAPVDGVPAKAFEVVVKGGTDQDIVDAIWAKKAAGVESFGSSSGTVTDSQGVDHTIYFTRPSEIDLYVEVDVTTNTDPDSGPVYPGDGDTQIKDALVAWAQANLQVGDDVILSQMYATIFGIAGVVDVTRIEVDNVTPTVAAGNYSIASREVAVFDTSRITVTSV